MPRHVERSRPARPRVAALALPVVAVFSFTACGTSTLLPDDASANTAPVTQPSPQTTGPSTTGPSTTGPSTTGPHTTGPHTTGTAPTETTVDTTTATDPVGPDPETASWVDEFDDDGLNLGVWGYESPFFGSGDGSAHLYDPGAIEVRDGLLVITASRLETPLSVDDDNDGTADRDLTWQSGFLTTRDRYSFTYGRIDVRARVPAGQGLWPAIWLRPADRTYGSWPKSGEIDIVEILGHEPDRAHTTAHWSNEGHTLDAVPYDMTPTEDGFHIFSLEWSPERLTWFIDGQLVHELIGWPSEVGAAPAPFDQDFYLNVNMAVGGNWPGAPDDSTPEGARFEVDWIRVHELDEAGT